MKHFGLLNFQIPTSYLMALAAKLLKVSQSLDACVFKTFTRLSTPCDTLGGQTQVLNDKKVPQYQST